MVSALYSWRWGIPLPTRRPFREARLWIDAAQAGDADADGNTAVAARIALPAIQHTLFNAQGCRMVIGAATAKPDAKLLALVMRARQARAALMRDIAAPPLREPYSPRHLAQMAQLGYLAPSILAAIVDARQPPTLTARSLSRIRALPLDWRAQEKLLGISVR